MLACNCGLRYREITGSVASDSDQLSCLEGGPLKVSILRLRFVVHCSFLPIVKLCVSGTVSISEVLQCLQED